MTYRSVMISSTTKDLPEHRQSTIEAVLRMGLLPKAMDFGTASDSSAVQYSLTLVDKSDIYVGIFAFRYGYVPVDNNPSQISITEMEYRHAVSRKIPTLIFIASENHNVKRADVESEPDKLQKLDNLMAELKTKYVVAFFDSPNNLGARVYQALKELVDRQP